METVILSEHFSLSSHVPHAAFSKCVVFILQVQVAPVESKRRAHLLPSVNHSAALHAMAIHMVALMAVLLWQVSLVAPVLFPSVWSFLLEVTLANSEKTWWKAGEYSIQGGNLAGVSSVDATMHSH